ncbi:MAG TPA: sigma-54 dependent transcriptional regulator [Sedimentisphaerales bacterium]|nr:sigma-54 dependent transcriptional regulator [Sedimentisphaerales bacterium]
MSLRKIVALSRDSKIQQLAQQAAEEVFAADDLSEALEIVEAVNPDLILLDHWCNRADTLEFLRLSSVHSIDVPIIVVGDGENSSDPSAELVSMGARDYLRERHDYNELRRIVRDLENKPETIESEENASEFFAEDYAASVSMVGHSRAFVKTLGMIRLVAASRCNPVLIVGETGTGKELAAKAIHTLRHPDEPFVAVNCAALTANLLESELFGHEKGSFTGADREKIGLLELAGGGTVLLDEISEMPIELQTKLLRILQERTFRRVGGVKDIKCKATIVATSNRNLYRETRANRFRRDLYYRLNICPVIIAPLRSPDRREDICLLTRYFLKTSAICPEKTAKIKSPTRLAMEALEKHDWPGNVRELRNVIDRAILLETTDKIGLSSIMIDPPDYFEQSENGHPAGQDNIKDFSLAKAERELIARALQETGWQKTQAAALLGITRATLYAKVKQYNIEKGSRMMGEAQGEEGGLVDVAEELDKEGCGSYTHRITAAP